MEQKTDLYKTILKPSKEIIFKEKKSKFYGYVFPIKDEGDVKPILETLKKQHYTANHVCYAWQLGVEKIRYRANDDGEPNNSAGMPIYGQIQSFGVTNVLVAVARIFGGTKLGVGGLIGAYRTAAQLALDEANIISKTLRKTLELSFDYKEMDKVMRIIKQQQLETIFQKMEMDCTLIISVRKKESIRIKNMFDKIQGVTTKVITP
ncbi:YigZ family protein [uncultured Kriegella sp.]|uniref:IMPACT family protein n=1 Tax=uncultured Kriegella sp. TaxID=1798910 RepID=UPI0030D7AAE2|tara:strand:+ start:388830 stop:389447 length:618 start_codon:yes stop_codon:yes gene_type:complete